MSTCFVSAITPPDILYLEYQRIAERFIGWTLTEVKSMPYYERHHWVQVILNEA